MNSGNYGFLMKYKKNPKLSKNRNLQESNKAGKKRFFLM